MKQLFSIIALAALTISCSDSSSLSTDEEKALYVMGHYWGSNKDIHELKLSSAEISALTMGLRDAIEGNEPAIDIQAFAPRVEAILTARQYGNMSANSEAEKQQGQAFIEEYLKNNVNAKQTPTGLVYEILEDGTGSAPIASDTVEVHYTGTLIDGTVFDSSVQRNQSVTFPLNQVIPGWTEGMQFANEGGKIKLIIPAELAYGDAGMPPNIPGGATLVFEVQLIKVNPEPKPIGEMEQH